jgi:Phage tail lysozyme
MSKRRDALLLGIALSAATACSNASPESIGTSRSAGTTAFPNDQTAYDYFRGKGLTNFQAAGVVGNLDQESGVDPTIAQQGGGPGRGIAQWSVGGRWDTSQGDNFVAFAAQEGQPTTSLSAQLDFVWYELTMFSVYGLAPLQATTNVTDATVAFENDFEECASCDESARTSFAMDVLSAYGNDPVVTDAGAGTGSEGGTVTEAGAGTESGTATEAGGMAGGDAGMPGSGTAGDDAGASVGVDAASPGQGGELAWSQGSGCAVATAGSREEAVGAWLMGLGLVLGRLSVRLFRSAICGGRGASTRKRSSHAGWTRAHRTEFRLTR